MKINAKKFFLTKKSLYLCAGNDAKTKTNIMTFTKTFDTDQWGNVYTSDCGVYELYKARTHKNNGTSKCDGNWIVQKNGEVLTSFPTLRKAKQVVLMDSMH